VVVLNKIDLISTEVRARVEQELKEVGKEGRREGRKEGGREGGEEAGCLYWPQARLEQERP
jgi:G3E family GTPase